MQNGIIKGCCLWLDVLKWLERSGQVLGGNTQPFLLLVTDFE